MTWYLVKHMGKFTFTHWVGGWMGPIAVLDATAKRKFLFAETLLYRNAKWQNRSWHIVMQQTNMSQVSW